MKKTVYSTLILSSVAISSMVSAMTDTVSSESELRLAFPLAAAYKDRFDNIASRHTTLTDDFIRRFRLHQDQITMVENTYADQTLEGDERILAQIAPVAAQGAQLTHFRNFDQSMRTLRAEFLAIAHELANQELSIAARPQQTITILALILTELQTTGERLTNSPLHEVAANELGTLDSIISNNNLTTEQRNQARNQHAQLDEIVRNVQEAFGEFNQEIEQLMQSIEQQISSFMSSLTPRLENS